MLKDKLLHSNHHIVFPGDCNHMRTIFGGTLIGICDLVVAQHTMLLVANTPCDDAVTVHFDVDFPSGAVEGDLVTAYSELTDVGIKSLTFKVWATALNKHSPATEWNDRQNARKVALGNAVFVTRKDFGGGGKAHPHGLREEWLQLTGEKA